MKAEQLHKGLDIQEAGTRQSYRTFLDHGLFAQIRFHSDVMLATNDLLLAIEALANSLESSGKHSNAQYFRQVCRQLVNARSEAEARELVERLATSGAMAQYADFSPAEDALFEKVFEEADKLR